MIKQSLKIFCALALISAGALQATIVGYNYSGTVTSLHGPPEPGFAGLAAGSTVFGSFVYDTAASGSVGANSAVYAAQSMFVQVGPLSYSPVAPFLVIELVGGYFWDIGARGRILILPWNSILTTPFLRSCSRTCSCARRQILPPSTLISVC